MLINTKNVTTSVVSTFHILTHPRIYHVYILYYGNSYRFRLPMTKLATGKISEKPLWSPSKLRVTKASLGFDADHWYFTFLLYGVFKNKE